MVQSPDRFRELVGEIGEPRANAISALAKYGISVAPSTISDIRSKKHKPEFVDGNEIATRLGLALFRETGSATAKLINYSAIGQAGVDLRKPQKTSPHRFSFEGLPQNIAKHLDITRVELGRLQRAIRLDICFGETMEHDQIKNSMFFAAVDKYVTAYTRPGNARINERVKAIGRRLGSLTIEDFYRSLYTETSGAGIGTWLPYEVEFVGDFYHMLLAEGQSKLSDFDKFTLEARIKGETTEYAYSLRRRTGILADKDIICAHVSILTSSPALVPNGLSIAN